MTAFLMFWAACAIAQATAFILAALSNRDTITSALVASVLLAPVAFIVFPIVVSIVAYANVLRKKGVGDDA